MIKCEGSPGQHSGELANDENVIFGVLPLKQRWTCGHACLRLVAWMEPSPCESGT